EVEIVANEILSLVCANEKEIDGGRGAALRFHEIGLIVPDVSYDQYVPHLETVFAAQKIPIEIVNRRFGDASRVSEAIELLLRLPLSRLTRDDLMRLLIHPALIGDEEVDSDACRAWSEQLGIFFGADSEDLRDTYIEGDLFHWEQGIQRLILGTFMAGDKSGVDAIFATTDGHRLLPLEVPQDAVAGVARLTRLARSLISDALDMRAARLTLVEWSRMLSELVSRYVVASQPADLQVRDHFLAAIDQMSSAELQGEKVGYPVAHELARARVEGLGSRRGKLSESGVSAGPFSSLHSIPYKIIFALGLNEGVFPAHAANDLLDLRATKREAGDVTPAERDRYMFLETILAARERLYLSYVARDARTGDGLEPSTLISELKYIVRDYLDESTIEKLTVKHRVSRYDLDYFAVSGAAEGKQVTSALSSFDPDARRGARMSALRRSLGIHMQGRPILPRDELLGALPERIRIQLAKVLRIEEAAPSSAAASNREEISLPITAIRNFLECPLQASARYGLGMFREDDLDEEAGDEPLELSRMQSSVLLREVFWQPGGDIHAIRVNYDAAFQRAQLQGHAPAGFFADSGTAAHEAQIATWIAEAGRLGAKDLTDWQDVRIGRADEFSHADRLLPAISLPVLTTRPDGKITSMTVNLHGTVRRVSPRGDSAIHCAQGKSSIRHFLPMFINAIILSAAGEKIADNFRAIVLGENQKATCIKRFSCPGQQQARDYLAKLVGSLLSANHNYYLPVEAVEKAVVATEKDRDPIDAIEEQRVHEWSYCSSDSGPIHKFMSHSFDPPSLEEFEKILNERFGPIRAMFEKGKRE
ncbi:MAG: Exodeoxyribonuclease, partial [Candidatus Binatus sp.]|nr:Exodeoxyribonuclease [Candidatus Binatus sp.]